MYTHIGCIPGRLVEMLTWVQNLLFGSNSETPFRASTLKEQLEFGSRLTTVTVRSVRPLCCGTKPTLAPQGSHCTCRARGGPTHRRQPILQARSTRRPESFGADHSRMSVDCLRVQTRSLGGEGGPTCKRIEDIEMF